MQDQGTGQCRCGCGQLTSIATRNDYRRGHVKGQPIPFIHGHNGRKRIRWLETDRGYKTPCWVWQLRLFGSGYGMAWLGGGKTRVAHRVVYEERVGAIPEGLDLDHLCRVRCCVNPDHLEPVTRRENLLRGETLTRANADKTHCPHGHPYDDENTIVRASGSRVCRACNRARNRRLYQARTVVA